MKDYKFDVIRRELGRQKQPSVEVRRRQRR